MTDTLNLLPCPFCGSPGEIVAPKTEQGERYWYVGCTNSHCPLDVGSCPCDTESESLQVWNNRAPVSPSEIPVVHAHDENTVWEAINELQHFNPGLYDLAHSALMRLLKREAVALPNWLMGSAQALLDMDAANTLAPHGIGAHARDIIEAFIKAHKS